MIQTAPQKRHKILIVEDDLVNRQILYGILYQHYECILAGSAEEAFELTQQNKFSLILTDIILPNMTGLEFMNKVKKFEHDAVFMVMSAETKIENAVESLRLGAFDYLVKPFDIAKVKLYVNRAIEHFEYKSFRNNYKFELEEKVKQRTIQYNYALEEIDCAYRTTLKSLVRALERKFWNHTGITTA